MSKEIVMTLKGTDPRIKEFLEVQKEIELNNDDPYADYSEGVDWDELDTEVAFRQENVRVIGLFVDGKLNGIIPISPIDTSEYPYLSDKTEISWFYFLRSETPQSWELIMKHMLSFHKHVILSWEYTPCNLSRYGYVSSEDSFEHGRYIYRYLRPIVHADYKNEIRDHYQNHYQKGEILSFHTRVESKEKLKNGIYKGQFEPSIPLYLRSNGFDSFLGFTYFNANDLRNQGDNVIYFSAYSSEVKEGHTSEKLVGILKLAIEKDYKVLAFIDVHFDYRRMGISKLLYKELNEFLTENDILVSTRLSFEGRAAGLDKIRSSIITKCPMYQTLDDYQEKQFKSYV